MDKKYLMQQITSSDFMVAASTESNSPLFLFPQFLAMCCHTKLHGKTKKVSQVRSEVMYESFSYNK